MEAAFAGNTELVAELLEEYARQRDQEGRTALMLAAQEGHVEIVEMLAPYELGQADEDGWTALMYASWSGNWDCVRYLSHQEIRMRDCSGWTALMSAAWNGHLEVVNYLYSEEVGMQDVDGWTALMCAAWNGHLDVVKLLYEREKGMVDQKGWTALMSAAWNGHYSVVKFLMGAEARVMDPYGWTALMSAVWNNHGSVAELLIDTEGPLILENTKVMRMVSVARKNDSITFPTGQQDYLYSKSVVHTIVDPDASFQQCISADTEVSPVLGEAADTDTIEKLKHELMVAHDTIKKLEALVDKSHLENDKGLAMEIERLKEEGATYKSRAEKYDDARHEVEALNKTVRLMKEEIDRVKNEQQQSQSVLDALLASSEDHEMVKLTAEVQRLSDIVTRKDREIDALKRECAEYKAMTTVPPKAPSLSREKKHRFKRLNSVSGAPRRHSGGLRMSIDECSDIEAHVVNAVILPTNIPRGVRKKSISQFPAIPSGPVAVQTPSQDSDDFYQTSNPSTYVPQPHILNKTGTEALASADTKPLQQLNTDVSKNISYYEDKSLNSFFQEPSELGSGGADSGTIRQILREFAKVRKELEQIKRQQFSMGKDILSAKNEASLLRTKIGAKAADPEDLKVAIIDVISSDPTILRSCSATVSPILGEAAVCSPCGHRIATSNPESITKCPQCGTLARAISLRGV